MGTKTPREIVDMIPEVTDLDMAFGLDEKKRRPIAELADEAIANQGWGAEHARQLFFHGGHLPVHDPSMEEISAEEHMRVRRWVRALLPLFEVEHEVKIAVCGLLFDTFCLEMGQEEIFPSLTTHDADDSMKIF